MNEDLLKGLMHNLVWIDCSERILNVVEVNIQSLRNITVTKQIGNEGPNTRHRLFKCVFLVLSFS